MQGLFAQRLQHGCTEQERDIDAPLLHRFQLAGEAGNVNTVAHGIALIGRMRLLQEVGMEVLHDESRRVLKSAGAEVDETNQRVRFAPELIETCVAKAPAEFTLEARNPAHNVTVGGPHVIFAATGGPAFASDLDRGRRAGNYQDMCDYIRVVHRLNVIHQEGGCPIEPTDLPAETRHLDFYRAAIALTDKTWQCWALGGYRVEDAIEMAAIAMGKTREQLKASPVTLTVVNSNSPLRLDINLPAFRLDAYIGDSLVRTIPIAVGMPAYKSPRGEFAITSIEWNPWWIPPKSPWAAKEKVTPPGPGNPMGRVKLNFRELYFLHGTPLDATSACPSLKTDPSLMAQLQAKAVTDDAMLAADIASHKTAPAAGAKVGIDPIATGAI